MRTSQRKAQEVALREHRLIELALTMINQEGFHNLTLGRLADVAGFSKGTVYNHFVTREDLLIELSSESARRQLRYYQALAQLPMPSLQMLYGLALAYELHAEVSPVLFECSVTARTESVCSRASEVRLARRDLVESQIQAVAAGVVQGTVRDGHYTGSIAAPLAIDAVRSHILGYGLMGILSGRFLWAGPPEASTRLEILAGVFAGLGWDRLDVVELTKLNDTIASLVESVDAAAV